MYGLRVMITGNVSRANKRRDKCRQMTDDDNINNQQWRRTRRGGIHGVK